MGHQRIHDLKILPLGDGCERGVGSHRREIDVAGIKGGKHRRIATGNRRPFQGKPLRLKGIEGTRGPNGEEAHRGRRLPDAQGHRLLGIDREQGGRSGDHQHGGEGQSVPNSLHRSTLNHPSGCRSVTAGCQRNSRRSSRDASILAVTTKTSNRAMPAKTPAGS